MREIPWNLVRGYLMGAADVVPGVSGGTVALVLGIYRRLVASIRHGSTALGRALRADGTGFISRLRRVEWGLLLPLLAGIGLAVVSLARLLERLLREQPAPMAGLFLGLVGGSAVVAWRLVERRDAARVAVAVSVAVTTFVALGLRPGTSEETVAQLADPALWAFFAAGAVAICAMILPGVSGSFLLVLLGMYGPVLRSVTQRDLAALAVFLAGAAIGLALFSQALHWALDRHYDAVMAGLVGLMAGSLRVLWPWPAGVDSTVLGAPAEAKLLTFTLAVLAAVAVVTVTFVAERVEHRDRVDEVADLRSV